MNAFLYYPVRQPINPTNPFGHQDAMYTALGQKGHPGVDFEAPSGTPVYAPCEGGAFYVTDKDGGCGLWIRYPNNTPDSTFNVILWHMYPKGTAGFPYRIPTNGEVTQVTAGQFLGYSDNSGAPLESSGPHLHVGVMPCDKTGGPIDPTNGYLGCVDPTPYFTGDFAQDINTPPIPPLPPPLPPNPTPVQESNWLSKISAWLAQVIKKLQNPQ